MFRLALALCLLASPALASQCIQLSQNETPTVWRAATPGAGLDPDQVRIVYVAHSAFQIETGDRRDRRHRLLRRAWPGGRAGCGDDEPRA